MATTINPSDQTITQYTVQSGGANNLLNNVGPGNTGQVLQSGGNASQPVYSTATYPSASSAVGKILYDNGTNFVDSVPTFPASASATIRKIIVSDGTNWNASTETYAVPGASGNVLTSDGTNWLSSTPAAATLAPNSTVQLFDDFTGYTLTGVSSFVASQLMWTLIGTGFVVGTADNGHPGVLNNASTTNGSTGGAFLFENTSATRSFILGGGAITVNFIVKIATLSTGTNRFAITFGLGDSTATALGDQANGVYFQYADNLNSGSWIGKTASASSRTSANSSNAADTSYHNFQISINAGATSVSYFIDGVQIANSPLSTNIPTASVSPFLFWNCTVGTMAASSVSWDLFYMKQTLTTPR